ncbi:MAG: LamG domain-containing protein [Coleofasciculus sp. G3-WIS-01]|uniref:LamG domain-containing protein n=1 Tax=Coleofasciculus sp. G3-WIS-01 TaxID=3069528 RepID=UPI0032FB0F62
MVKDSHRPRNDDMVLGGQNPPPTQGVVLGGIAGVRMRLTSPVVDQRLTAITEATAYGDAGLNLVLQAFLQDESPRVRQAAYLLLWDNTQPWVKQAIQHYVPANRVAWWRLNETEGDIAADTVGGNNGTIKGATPVTIVPGRMAGLGGAGHPDEVNPDSYRFVEFVLPQGLGSALQFDGDDYVEIPHGAALNFGVGDFSIGVGVKTRSRGLEVILDKRVETSGSVQGYCLYLHQGRLGLQLADGIESAWTNYDSQCLIADDRWHYLVVTVDRDGIDGGRWYVDGIELRNRFNPKGRQGSLNNFKPLRLGRRSDHPGAPGFFQGRMSDVQLFNRSLAAPEIQAVYQRVGVKGTRSGFIHK